MARYIVDRNRNKWKVEREARKIEAERLNSERKRGRKDR